MEKQFLKLSSSEFDDLDASLNDICEENEKFPANALFFLTNALQSSSNIIKTCKMILREHKFPKDINLICGLNMHYNLYHVE